MAWVTPLQLAVRSASRASIPAMRRSCASARSASAASTVSVFARHFVKADAAAMSGGAPYPRPWGTSPGPARPPIATIEGLGGVGVDDGTGAKAGRGKRGEDTGVAGFGLVPSR